MDNSIEDLEISLQEIEAYRELDSEPFNFGTGLIYNDHSYGSEDAYYKMYIDSIENVIEELKSNIEVHKTKRHIKLNKYDRNKILQERYKELEKRNKYTVWYSEEEERYIKCYYSKKRKLAHRQWIKTVRRTNNFKLKGNNCYKAYDYWRNVID